MKKWLILIICFVLLILGLIGGLIYEKISNSNTVKLLNDTITIIRADNDGLLEEMDFAREYVAGFKSDYQSLERENTNLKRVLGEGKAAFDFLRQENAAIRTILERSIEDTGSVSKLGQRAADQIDEVIGIIKSIKANNY